MTFCEQRVSLHIRVVINKYRLVIVHQYTESHYRERFLTILNEGAYVPLQVNLQRGHQIWYYCKQNIFEKESVFPF